MNVRRSVPMDVKVRKRTNLMGITPLRFAQPPQPQEAVRIKVLKEKKGSWYQEVYPYEEGPTSGVLKVG